MTLLVYSSQTLLEGVVRFMGGKFLAGRRSVSSCPLHLIVTSYALLFESMLSLIGIYSSVSEARCG